MIPVRDVWGPGTLNPAKIRAYKRLDDRELIRMQHIRMQYRQDITTFDYLSSKTENEIHALLKGAESEEHNAVT